MPKRKLQNDAAVEEAADTMKWSEYTVAKLKGELGARG
jgi:hypothetical protein